MTHMDAGSFSKRREREEKADLSLQGCIHGVF